MSPRERNMVIGFLGVILIGGGAFGGYTLVYSPLSDINTAKEALEKELEGTADKPGLESREEAMRKAMPRVAAAKQESLPPNPDIAKNQYQLLLERLMQRLNITGQVKDSKTLESKAPITPELAPKKPAYTRTQYSVEMEKADIWQVSDFLEAFYGLGLLHQITDVEIQRQNKITETRRGLKVTLTIEAISLDGAEARVALFPPIAGNKLTGVGEAIAALGGGRAAEAVAAAPELARRLTARTSEPVLATKHRDYSWLALNDVFYGVLHTSKIPPGIAIKLSNVTTAPDGKQSMTIKPGQRLPGVTVRLSGDGADEATVEAVASNGTSHTAMLPDGPLEVDPNTRTIHFPTPNEASGRTYSWVGVTVTGPDGRTQKSQFQVLYAGDDISAAIRLVNVGESEGVNTAQILDIASPHKYNLTAIPKKEIEVVKYRPAGRTMKDWEKDPRYKQPPGVLVLSDDTSSTRRIYRVVAIEEKSVVVQELDKPDAKPDLRTATLYRWLPGRSLADVPKNKLTSDEAKKLVACVSVAAETPVSATAK